METSANVSIDYHVTTSNDQLLNPPVTWPFSSIWQRLSFLFFFLETSLPGHYSFSSPSTLLVVPSVHSAGSSSPPWLLKVELPHGSVLGFFISICTHSFNNLIHYHDFEYFILMTSRFISPAWQLLQSKFTYSNFLLYFFFTWMSNEQFKYNMNSCVPPQICCSFSAFHLSKWEIHTNNMFIPKT